MNSLKSITGTAGKRQTFTKAERLCSTKLISEIFENGRVFFTSGFRIVWIISPVELPFRAQTAFSVPKKIFKNAVTRNLIKRRFRESYRRNKHKLYDFLTAAGLHIAFVVIYRQSSIPDYRTLDKYVVEAIETLCSQAGRKEK
jgi:ribonuclease P protein component